MKILFVKVFGIGNAVMAIPALKALRSIISVERLDVLVGNTPDDVGAYDIMQCLVSNGVVDSVIRDPSVVTEVNGRWDTFIGSIPYDRRWGIPAHWMDCRTRPDPSTTGLVSWKKHEIEYQMENAYNLGYIDVIPNTEFLTRIAPKNEKLIYFGLGYKKDLAGFWKKKHWGNEKYISLAKKIFSERKDCRISTTGDQTDFVLSIAPMIRELQNTRFEYWPTSKLKTAFDCVSLCGTYVGNDTGMMHIAASAGVTTVPLFFLENSITKSYPWEQRENVIDGIGRDVSVDEVWEKIKSVKGW